MNIEKVRKALEAVCEELTAAYLDAEPGEGVVARMNVRKLEKALQHANECTFWVRWLAESPAPTPRPQDDSGLDSFDGRLRRMEDHIASVLGKLEAKCEQIGGTTAERVGTIQTATAKIRRPTKSKKRVRR